MRDIKLPNWKERIARSAAGRANPARVRELIRAREEEAQHNANRDSGRDEYKDI